jgi:hypothetical protein
MIDRGIMFKLVTRIHHHVMARAPNDVPSRKPRDLPGNAAMMRRTPKACCAGSLWRPPPARRINAMNLKNVLGQIEPNCRDRIQISNRLFHG